MNDRRPEQYFANMEREAEQQRWLDERELVARHVPPEERGGLIPGDEEQEEDG